MKPLKLSDYPFENIDFIHYFKNLYHDRGLKAFYQFLNRPHRRPYSRSLIKRFSPSGIGLELGCGARTISPTNRTVLSDAYSEHGVHGSIAKIFFKGDTIPYPDNTFQFLISEHVLEHIANPIKTLNEWIRVLSPGGKIFLFLPHGDRTNDQHREKTTLDHLIQDFQNDVPFNDPTHFDEWKKNVIDKNLMPGHYQHLDKDELLNTASIHHHVWSEKEISQLLEYLDLKVIHVDEKVYDRRDSFVVIAEKK